MSLRPALLKNVKRRGNKLVAQCPACAEVGRDKKGVHLVLYPSGAFECIAVPKNKAHRRRIAELVGDPLPQLKPWALKLGGKVVMNVSAPASMPITSLARRTVVGLLATPKQPSGASGVAQTMTTPDAPDGSPVHSSHKKLDGANNDSRECPGDVSQQEASAPSGDIVAAAAAMFCGTVTVFHPGDLIPNRFADVLRTWAGAEGLGHNLPPPRPRLLGWTRRGVPVYAKSRRS
jgi:hypothetical protein